MNFNDLKKFYFENFSLGYLNSNDEYSAIECRFILISLICYVYDKNKPKNPDLTYYEIIRKIDKTLPDDFIKSLAIICEDFAYGSKSFPTFGLSGKNILEKIKSILNTYVPF